MSRPPGNPPDLPLPPRSLLGGQQGGCAPFTPRRETEANADRKRDGRTTPLTRRRVGGFSKACRFSDKEEMRNIYGKIQERIRGYFGKCGELFRELFGAYEKMNAKTLTNGPAGRFLIDGWKRRRFTSEEEAWYFKDMIGILPGLARIEGVGGPLAGACIVDSRAVLRLRAIFRCCFCMMFLDFCLGMVFLRFWSDLWRHLGAQEGPKWLIWAVLAHLGRILGAF